jgi:hypothetical protein
MSKNDPNLPGQIKGKNGVHGQLKLMLNSIQTTSIWD